MKKGEQAVEESIAVVRRQFLEGGEPLGPPTETNETIEVHRFVVEPAKIQVGRGLTLNLGNYESARLDVGISVPCYIEEAASAYEWARRWVEQRVKKEASDIRGETSDDKPPKKNESPF